MDLLLHRIGWSVQVPARRAAERDEAAVAAWQEETWPVIKGRPADQGAWLVFEDESGQGLRPPKGRTWGRRGRTPVVTVTGGSNKPGVAGRADRRPAGRAAPADLPGAPPPAAGDRRKGFTEADYARLLDAAHQQLGGPLVLVWDNLNTHVSKAMRELDRGPGLADGLPAPALRLRAQPGRVRLVAPEDGPWPTWPNATSPS